MFKFIEIRDFDRNNLHLRQTLAELLAAVFPHSYRDSAAEEAEKLLGQERIALAALDGDALVGFIGAIPQYGITGWELHPLAVQEGYRGHGIGSMLIRALEEEAAARGGITIYLGTDDEFFATSLSDNDLYIGMYQKIAGIRNLRRHPYEFYQKNGYHIVGVIPDANGI